MWFLSSFSKWSKKDISESAPQWIQKKKDSLCEQPRATLPDLMPRCLSKHKNIFWVTHLPPEQAVTAIKNAVLDAGELQENYSGKKSAQGTPLTRDKYIHSDLRCILKDVTPLKGRWFWKSQASNNTKENGNEFHRDLIVPVLISMGTITPLPVISTVSHCYMQIFF